MLNLTGTGETGCHGVNALHLSNKLCELPCPVTDQADEQEDSQQGLELQKLCNDPKMGHCP